MCTQAKIGNELYKVKVHSWLTELRMLRTVASSSDIRLKDLILVDSIAGCVGVLIATSIFILLLCGKAFKTGSSCMLS